jgi:hypothetical protein
MKEKYHVDELGIVHQSNFEKFDYDKKYIQKYFDYGEKENHLSYLRLGFLLACLNEKPKSILDIGYGSGSFLKACTNYIPNCYGHDITGVPVPDKVTFVEDIYKDEYDIITFFDVLEHFEDVHIIGKLKCNYIMITLPWCYNFENKNWFENWKHRKPNEHLHHFNHQSLVNLFEKHKFQCIKYGNIEDTIRKDSNNPDKNILTAVFKKDKWSYWL